MAEAPPGSRLDGQDDERFAELVASLDDGDYWHPAPAPRALAHSIVPCAPLEAEGDCDLRASAAFDPSRGEWVTLGVDSSEGGPESITIAAHDGTNRRVLHEGDVSAGSLARARRIVRGYRNLPEPTNLVEQRAIDQFSLNMFARLVSLRAPLDGWLLMTETTETVPEEEVLVLVRGDGSDRRVLARRPASVGSCDGGGFWCERLQRECTLEELRAENRACAQPMSLDFVALAENGLLLAQGTRQVAGHGGYPPAAWVVSLPAELR